MRAFDLAARTPWAIKQEALEVILEIAARQHEVDIAALESRLGHPLDNTQTVTYREAGNSKIALLPVEGPIFPRANLFTQISGATSVETLARDFTAIMDDDSVSALVANFDTPGGAVSKVGEFADMVYEARGRKPMVAYVGNQCCSAGMWIASAFDHIVAAPTAELGSIGVVATYRDTKKADEKAGIKTYEFVSSNAPLKRSDPSTKDGQAQIKQTVDAIEEVFINTVARNRGVSRNRVIEKYGQGGTFIGIMAVKAGLADSIGSLEQVIALLQVSKV